MGEQPLISVFMPTYNQQEFVAEAIESVLSQNYDNIEIIIGDDCSQDNTWKIVLAYQESYPVKIKAFRNAVNLGITRNCNQVLRNCTGKYIVFFAGDDLFLPEKISKQVKVMERDESVILSYHDIEVFNSDDNKILRYWNSGPLSAPPVEGLAKKVAKELVVSGTLFMAASSVMIRKDAVPFAGYDSRLAAASDWLFWIDLLAGSADGSKVEFIPRVLYRYRRHLSNVTNAGYKHTADNLVTLAIIEDRYPWLIREVDQGRALVRYATGVRYFLGGEYKLGRIQLIYSLRSGWVSWKIFYWFVASYITSLL